MFFSVTIGGQRTSASRQQVDTERWMYYLVLFSSRLEPKAELMTLAEVFRKQTWHSWHINEIIFLLFFLLSIGKIEKNKNRRINPRPRSREFFYLLPKCDKILLSVWSNTSAITKAIFRFYISKLARKQQTFGLKSSLECSNYRVHTLHAFFSFFFKTHFFWGGCRPVHPTWRWTDRPSFPPELLL